MDKEEYKRNNDERDRRRETKLLYERILESRIRQAQLDRRWGQRFKRAFAWWKVLSDRFAFLVALFTGALALVAYLQWVALRNTDRATNDLALAALKQVGVMQGQLDAMETDKRPWIGANVWAVKPIIFTEWNGSKGITVPLNFVLKNYGNSPAINLRLWPQIVVHPGNQRRKELDVPEQVACDSARAQADENTIGGFAIFPSETLEEAPIPSISGVYKSDEPILFSVLGCIDYTFGNNRHGQTGFRMLLGREAHGQIFGLPFIEGAPIEDYHPSAELLAGGYPPQAPKQALLQPNEFYFRPDDGGNYAK